MATFRQRASAAKLVVFLYLLFCIKCAASDSVVFDWKDPSQVADIHAGSLSFTNVPSTVLLRSSTGNIKLQDIPQVISLALGFSSLQNIDWDGLSVGNIFSHPKANVLFIIDGVSKVYIGHAVSFKGNSPTYTIIKNEAESNLDLLQVSPVRNFVSQMSNILKDKPLVISFSAQKQLANAASSSGINAHTISWDDEEAVFKDKTGSSEIQLTKDELLKMFETADLGEGVKYVKKEHKFVVSIPGIKDVSFDMNEMDDFLFFAEIQTLFYLYEKVNSFDSLVHDDFADFFTFGISTVKGLSQRYGNGSYQIMAALHVLDNVIPKITNLFNKLYDGQALVEVVNLRTNERDEQLVTSNDMYYNDGERELRFRRDVSAQKEECKDDKGNLAFFNDYYDNEFPPIFNISLWLMVILVLTVYVVSIVMWYMDPGRDSIIYRVTSQRMKSE